MRVILRNPSPSRSASDVRVEAETALRGRAQVVMNLPSGTLAEVDERGADLIRRAGLDVVPLPAATTLRYGGAAIDVARGAALTPPKLRVPEALASTWPLHLLHLVAPLEPGWHDELARAGLEVLEVVSGQGVLVRATPDAARGSPRLGFVDWAGPLEPEWKILPGLREAGPAAQPVLVTFDPTEDPGALRERLAGRGAKVLRVDVGAGGDPHRIRVELDAAGIEAAAREPAVRLIEASPRREPCGERESQIVAENLDAAGAQPVTGYPAWLATLTYDGTGETISVCDTGVDRNGQNNAAGHADIRGRMTAFVDYSSGADANDLDGHGSHVCGIAVGNAATGATEGAAPGNFLRGLGVAPGASYVVQNYLTANSTWPADTTLAQDAATNGATVINNSWAAAPSRQYTSDSADWDRAARDANTTAGGWQPLLAVFAAANYGGMPSSLGTPQEAKNTLVVGNGLNWRPGFGFGTDQINGLSPSSSRGPAGDGRIMPTVVAPGTDVSSIWSRFGDTGRYTPIAGTGTLQADGTRVDAYLNISGTSMAAPHVTGACALVSAWWRARTGKRPSPALLKALLIISAEDMQGGANWRDTTRWATERAQWSSPAANTYSRTLGGMVPTQVMRGNTAMANVAALTAADQWTYAAATGTLTVRLAAGQDPRAVDAKGNPTVLIRFLDGANVGPIPNNDQGWGRVSLENLFFQPPTSNRGPYLFLDQTAAFDAVGQRHAWTVAPVDPTRPMRVTMVYSDAPAAAASNPTLVNNLNIEVQQVGTATVYRGGAGNFVGGWSAPGGAADATNNVECVYVQAPAAGAYEVRVIASALQRDARPPYSAATPWQDFALVLENAAFVAASPVAVATVLDRSGSMVAFGYVDVTRLAARQFVDLLQVSDRLGLVSFSDAAAVEYADGADTKLITGAADLAAARAAVDGVVFSGCTYMGDGIARAGALLAGGAGRRAMVLLSDGYDNKGCDAGNPAKPGAAAAAAALPAGIGIYACAMGPTSDQGLLQSLASSTGGRYYYMPTIDDLLEVYNFIRGNVTGDSLSVNTSAWASRAAVPAVVDGCAEQATFVVSWTNPELRAVDREPKKQEEISVRLRDPAGRLLPAHASWIQRIVGEGYAILRVEDPTPGTWTIEVRTAREQHTRIQAACFLRSAIRLVTRYESVARAGSTFGLTVGAWHGDELLTRAKAVIRARRPTLSLPQALEKLRDRLAEVKLEGDEVASLGDLGRLGILLRRAGAEAILPTATDVVPMTLISRPEIERVPTPFRELRPTLPGDALRLRPLREDLRPLKLPGFVGKLPARITGTYNLAIEVSGVGCSGRFVRTELVSVLVT